VTLYYSHPPMSERIAALENAWVNTNNPSTQ
jgi:Zn-dependent protease with chaperone function